MGKIIEILKRNKIITISVILITLVLAISGAIAGILLSKNNEKFYIIQFESAGGSKIENQKLRKGEKVIRPDDPIKEGFDFIEWNLNGEVYDFDNLVSEDIILTARWEVKEGIIICKVSFDSDGGSAVEPIEVALGNAITEPIQPKKQNYSFKGWFLNDEQFDFNNAIENDINLIAKWEKVEEKNNNFLLTIGQFIGISNEEKDGKQDNESKNEENRNIENDEPNNNEQQNSIDRNVSWDFLNGTWYLTGTDDVYVKIKGTPNSYELNCTRFLVDPASVSYYNNGSAGSSGGGADCYTDPLSFAQYFNITSITNNSITFDNKYVFYKTPNYPSHKKSSLEILAENIEGTWYLEGYGQDVYIKFNYGIRYNEKVVFYDQHNYNGETATIFPISGGSIGYFDFYGLDTQFGIGQYGYSYSNGYIYVNHNGKKYRFSKNPTQASATEITLDNNNVNMHVGDRKTLRAIVNPNSANYNITWTSSDNSIVTVEDGNITAIRIGTAVITAHTNNGLTATCIINVGKTSTTGVSLNKNSDNVYVGKTINLTANVLPNNATNKNVIWSSSDSNIATVSSKGVVTGKNEGTAIITAKTEDGSYTASCTVNVNYMKLAVSGEIAFATKVTNNTYSSGVEVTAKPSGGTGNYTSYNIKLYYNGTLIGEGTSNSLFVNKTSNGTYRAVITVTDSKGNTASTTRELTKS